MKSLRQSTTHVFGLLTFLMHSVPAQAKSYFDRPKLTVVIVVDQLRADYIYKYERFLPENSSKKLLSGIRYLLESGAYFGEGSYDTLESMTCPGHSIVLSGSNPYRSGIVLNEWFDAQINEEVYCLSDPTATMVTSKPAQLTEKVSLKNFIGSTVGDELKLSGLKSKVASVAIKDRSALLLAGNKADSVLWLDSKLMEFVSNSN